ncbi:MAG: DUF952 domain-containing protein [Rhizobiaceae bacterium]|nr:DUF952 domain-containing protein [Rhizobiaceae bacterium]
MTEFIFKKQANSVSQGKIRFVYKIEDKDLWAQALEKGIYDGAPIDLSDGFIHFSTAGQARETAAKHFAGRDNLIIAAIKTAKLGSQLKWEVSRGGALFPHYYGELDMNVVHKTHDLPLDDNGNHVFSAEII